MPAAPGRVKAELLAALENHDSALQHLVLELRAVVLDELGPCHESLCQGYAVALGYGTSPRMKDQICHIAVYKKHVNLGFNRGTQLEDPDGVLEGTGKVTRHLRVTSVHEQPAIRRLLRQARALAEPAV